MYTCISVYVLLILASTNHKFAKFISVSEQNYPKAKRHFLYSGDIEDFGIMLVECATEHGNKGECEFFLAQAVLQLVLMHTYKHMHSS